MLSRLGTLNPFKYEFWTIIEAGLHGLLFVQALRFLIGMLYSRTASASLVTLYAPGSIPANTPGVVSPAIVSQEIALLGFVVALPLVALILGRFRFAFIGASLLVVGGRMFINTENAFLTPTMGAAVAVAGGLFYIALLIRNRATILPYFFVLGLGVDQIFRAYGNTLDPSWALNYANIQLGVSGVAFILAFMTALPERKPSDNRPRMDENRGLLTFAGAIGLGAMLYLQLSLLALPNAVAGRADAAYSLIVPLLVVATLLPLIPAVRKQALSLIKPFTASHMQGWAWLVLVVLLLVIGTRLQRISIGTSDIPVGGFALVIAQLVATLAWWWFAPPQGETRFNLTGLWLILTPLVFGVFVMADLFTYEYAYVRNFAPPLAFLNNVIPPLLRGFKGMGFGLILLAAFLMLLPMIQTRQARIPWQGGRSLQSFLMLVIVAAGAGAAGYYARPPVVVPELNMTELWVGTYNIHGGYSEFFDYDMDAVAQAIAQSGTKVILLQEVEAGRLTSFGVDQTLWLGRRLGMDRRFFPTNEGLQGLAVLSKVPIVFDDGILLPGVDQQTGLQRVQIRPDESAVTIYNTALGLLLQGSSIEEQESNQRAQLNTILATIEAHIQTDYGGQLGRAILGGTFNNVSDSPLLQTLTRTGFIDPFAGANADLSATLVRLDRKARIDYLWLWSQGLSSTGVNTIQDNTASDHRLAYVGVLIRRN